MTNNELAAFYRRYNACCNEHRFEDLREFVARDVVINGTDRGLDTYAEGLRGVIRAFPDYRCADRIAEVWGMAFHVQLLEQLRA
jgi:predicted ester cyclase